MNDKTVQLDVRQLGFPERPTAIFGTWEKLPVGQTLILINDHDPLPLQNFLRSGYNGKFTWEYQKQGPEEWVVAITKIPAGPADSAVPAEADRRTELKQILNKLHHARPDELPALENRA